MDLTIVEAEAPADLVVVGVQRVQEEIRNISAMMEEEITQEAPMTGEMIALLTVLSLFTVVGTVGNGLVLFVFSRVRDKTTAQIFILALAMIDLFTCMLIIPLTMYVEYKRYDIKYDWMCKLYQFLITSKVPLSAFIMVAIAFDRYFCICHPLRKIITPWRTKVTLLSLTLFAAMLGIMTSLAYGVNQVFSPFSSGLNSTVVPVPPDTIKDWTKLGEDPSTTNDITMSVELRLKLYMLKRNATSQDFQTAAPETVYIGICAPNEIILDWDFVSVYQKCYTVLFLICLVIVGALYGMIYRFIGMRRNKKLQQRLVLCAYVHSTHGCREPGTRITFINSNIHDNHNDDDRYELSSQGLGPGGIYIGGCSPTPPPRTHSEHVNIRKAGSNLNVSFAEPESDKPATEPPQGHGAEEVVTLNGIGNSPNSELSVNGEECEGGGGGTQDGEGGVRKGSHTSTPSREDVELLHTASDTKTSCEVIVSDTSMGTPSRDSGRKASVHKSPALGSRTHSKRKRLWKSSRRPKSLADDKDDGQGSTHRFCRRRASSPFKRDVGEGSTAKHAPAVEMRGLRCRRDSEPFWNLPCEVCSDMHPRGCRKKEEDFLTMGSRKHYDANYLETSIEEDYSTMGWSAAPHPDRLSDVTVGKDVPSNPSVPIIHVINNDVLQDSEVVEHHQADLSDSDTAEVRTPLLQDTMEEHVHRDNGLQWDEHGKSTNIHSSSCSTSLPCSNQSIDTNPSVDVLETPQSQDVDNGWNNTLTATQSSERELVPDVLSTPHATRESPDLRVEVSVTSTPLTSRDAPEIRVVPNSPPSLPEKPEIRVFESLWNNQVSQSSCQLPTLLTTLVRNVTSPGSGHASPPHSYSDLSRHWLAEESSVGGCSGLDPGHLLIPGPSSRRSTMESRSSTMDGAVPRPRAARKKRWQHFRSKNASIKAHHNRHQHKSASGPSSSITGNAEYLYGRRSVVSYDADRLRDETRAANARTALMLFTVTLVFVVAFLPAWLMAHRLVPTQLMVFYLYFTYNVANPFIYAFMNVIFKEQLRKIFRCWRKGQFC